jgi:hypothetical protein
MSAVYIKAEHLWILNLAMQHDQKLRESILEGIARFTSDAADVVKAIGTGQNQVPVQVPAHDPMGETMAAVDALAQKVLVWFRASTTKPQSPAQIREVFGDVNAKMLTRAVARLVQSGDLKWNNKRGPGSEYSVAAK